MRCFLTVLTLLFPTMAVAEVEISLLAAPTYFHRTAPTFQPWTVVRRTPTRLNSATTRSAPDSTVRVNAAGQVWRVTPAPLAEHTSTRAIDDDTLSLRGEYSEHSFRTGTPNYQILRTVPVVATAYNSRRNQTDGTPWRTANSRLVRDGDIACNFLPLGTLVRLTNGPEQTRGKILRVEDRLADPPPHGWNQIDIWMLHVSDAKAFGKQKLALQVLGDPVGEAPH